MYVKEGQLLEEAINRIILKSTIFWDIMPRELNCIYMQDYEFTLPK
jgi:hypothetical protein